MNNPFDFECVGNLHIHSVYSDGAKTVPEIARSARKAALDFIILNDHDYMTDDLHLEDEGLYDGVAVMMGLEIGGRHHHYLAFDLREMVRGNAMSPQEVIDRVNAQGGFGFLAHPFEKGMPFSERSVAYTWEDLSVKGYAGICIWNFMSRWKERIKTPVHGLFCLMFKSPSLRGPSRETISFWDEACQKGKVAAVGGSDAHGSMFRLGLLGFRPVSYDFLMNSVNVHLLLDAPLPKNFTGAKSTIYGALKEGHLYVAHDGLAPARGFRFYFVSDEGARWVMGQEGPYRPGSLLIDNPEGGEIRLVRNGSVEKVWRGKGGFYPVSQDGVYRVEVFRRASIFGWRPWIFSNPIYLR